MISITTSKAPTPGGHYSQAVVQGGLVFVSGQLPIDPATGMPHGGSVEEQTKQALENVAAVLDAAKSGIDRVVKTTIFVTDINEWGRVNEAYAEFFGPHRPARSVVPTRELHFGCLVEIEAIGVVGEVTSEADQ